jgi:photosystem II stability/assembly factor-like uncharacterized protein
MKRLIISAVCSAVFFTQFIISQWVITSAPVSLGSYPSISAANCSTVVLSGGTTNNPLVFRSTNSGVNFVNITGNMTGNEIYSVWALSEAVIFAGDGGAPGGIGGNARVFKTTNGGVNWSVILTTGGNSGFISGMAFSRYDPGFGIIVSDPPVANDSFWIAKTNDGGVNWRVTRAPYTPIYATQHSAFAVDSMFYGFGIVTSSVTQGRIYLTTDGGNTWNLRLIGLSANSVNSVSFREDKQTGIALSDVSVPNIARTTNAGINWLSANIGAGNNIVGHVKNVPGTSVFFSCSNKIQRSSDNGSSWFEMTTQGVQMFSHMDIVSSGANFICAYALASDGRVLKYEGEPFAVDPNQTGVPEYYSLSQNYPNPFNPATTVRYSLPKGGVVKVRVFDLNGREIVSVVNGYQHAGYYSETIDLDKFSSGIYYCTLESGSYFQAMKMVLIK